MIRGIVFDLFDTLVDQNHDQLRPVELEGHKVGATTPGLFARARDEFGVDLPAREFVDRLKQSDRTLRVDTIDQGLELSTLDRFTALGTDLGLADVLAFGRALTDVHMGALYEACSVPLHHEAVLMSLAIDYRMALCSNFSDAATARAIVSEAGFDPHLMAMVISEEMGVRKPRREIFDATIDALGLAPNEILHVGDNLVADIEGATAAGMRTVWLTRQIGDPEAAMARYEGPQPDFALEDLLDLPVLVARLGV